MEINNLTESIKKIKETSPKRNFAQTFDLVIVLRDLDLKKPEQQVDFYAPLHNL